MDGTPGLQNHTRGFAPLKLVPFLLTKLGAISKGKKLMFKPVKGGGCQHLNHVELTHPHNWNTAIHIL